MILSATGLEFGYRDVRILKDVSFELPKAGILSIIGPNGAGKSTLVKCLIKILSPGKGRIMVGRSDLARLKPREIARIFGYVPQKSVPAFPTTVFDTILMGRRPYCGWRSGRRDVRKTIAVLDRLGIKDLAMKAFDELSGGQQQKVLLGRALSQEPKILVLDEPTSNLDIRQQVETMEILREMVADQGISLIMVIHDLNLAAMYSDAVLLLEGGKVHDFGDPLSVITRDNIRAVYGLDAAIVKHRARPCVLPVRSEKRPPDRYVAMLKRSNTFTERLVRKAIRHLGLFDGCRILDVPCGIGSHSVWMAGENPKVTVIGGDIAEEHLGYAKELAARKEVNDRVAFQPEDIRNLSFEDNTFDFLWCCNGIWPGSPELGCIAREPYNILDELKRVLKPGGTLAILFWTSHRLLSGYPLLESALNATFGANHILPGCDVRPELHIMRTPGWLERAGLKQVRATTFVMDVQGPFSEEETGSMVQILNSFWAKAEKEISSDLRRQYQTITDPDSDDFIFRQEGYTGFVTYTMFTGIK